MDDLLWCIQYLKQINGINQDFHWSLKETFRALMNVTLPYDLSDEFYARQGKVLKQMNQEKGMIDVATLTPLYPKIYLVQKDITCLQVDAIVNACNEKMLGCFIPLHGCIDNAIHSFAGLEVRRDLMQIMEKQGHDEPVGQVKVTKGYHLPAKFIFHTVGPQVYQKVTLKEKEELRQCYLSCLKKADEMELKSLAFCSISTGVYHFPIQQASQIAIQTIDDYLKHHSSCLKQIIIDVFSKEDYDVYYQVIEKYFKGS